MKTETRKLATADYKKRLSIAGVFAIRCRASGEIWVGQAFDLDKIQNRIWFTLRMGDHRNAELQRAWSAHGEQNFALEALERIADEELAYVRDTLLKERVQHWRAQLNASAI
ncbi:GIY-YIG nuclease family protein [Bradyrhizobium sp. CCBAU 51753]|uniref:GIY-YIG nuclease family protein n=1 Tax=Bradyrhizobium sp. CCBAU 51753 TaxID=1325100 RepID=UPI00188A8898|nr:GIY-YIG nuclease family protein [Bradyrhizobium sp. CCBAU 51753]QOZ22426.1 GIY-YIG nuclease family protein [Bradyrhizobium sp. CCBAU 51753]